MPVDTEPERPPTALERELKRYLRTVALERGRSKHTVSAYRSDLTRYLEYLEVAGVHDAPSVTPELVTSYVNSLPGAASTITRKLSSIKNFHRFLVEESVSVGDPSSAIRGPARVARLPKALTIEQVQALLDSVVGEEPVALRDRALLEFLYATGAVSYTHLTLPTICSV